MQMSRALMAIALIVISGCAGSSIPVQPGLSPQANPAQVASDSPGHRLWGYYEISIDLDTLSATMVPDRAALTHFNVTSLVIPPKCADCFSLQVVSNDPVNKKVVLNVSLKNPSQVTGYEVRGIILPKVAGVTLANADSYTLLWNSGSISTRNPFRIFSAAQTLHPFPPIKKYTVGYDLRYQASGSLKQVGYAIDASWPDACQEPYQIDPPSSNPVLTGTNPGTISVDVHDWQNDIQYALLYPFPISGSDANAMINMAQGSGDGWSVSISNSNHVAEGDYTLWVQARSIGTDVATWQVVTVSVKDAPTPPATVDVRYYVAMDYQGYYPFYSDPFLGDIEWGPDIAYGMQMDATTFWNQYGFTYSDDGSYGVMDDPSYYLLDSDQEVFAMHAGYGQHYSPNALCVYFVQGIFDVDTAACYWPGSITSLSQHKSKDVFVVITPNTWFYVDVLAHESGHAFGALEDIYLLNPPGYSCDDLKKDEPPAMKYLYCDDTAYYDGNLMYGAPYEWSIQMYNLTSGQAAFAKKFQKDYPNNW